MIISGIAVFALILITMMTLLQNNTDNYLSQDIRNNVVNESFAAGTRVQLSSPSIEVGSITVYNASGRSPVGLGNFSIDYQDGSINLTTAGVAMYGGRTLNATYTGLTRSASYNMSTQGNLGLTTVSSYQPTLSIILAAIVVVGLVMGAFVFLKMG